MNFKKNIPIFLIIASFFLFFILRFSTLYDMTVPYTFDQGRDFLKAMEIVEQRSLTFLGPTTGMQGVFHGVWWYYLLIIPYILFQGAPIGFYYGICATFFISAGFFSLFIARRLSRFAGFMFFALIATSGYYIAMSVFAISSIMTIPFILLFLYSWYEHNRTSNNLYIGLLFFSLAHVFEGEVPFGVFLVASFFLTLIVTKKVRAYIGTIKKLMYACIGFLLPILPRILFEIKNNFLQTRAVIQFFTNPSNMQEASIQSVITARVELFSYYYKTLFGEQFVVLGIILAIVSLTGVIKGYRKISKKDASYFTGITLTTVFLFITSLSYKNTFWTNYYEGLSLFFIMLLVFGYECARKGKEKIIRYLFIASIGVLFFSGIIRGITSLNSQEVKMEGLRGHVSVVNWLYERTEGEVFCAKVYTPPAIPHTYNYLFSYYEKFRSQKKPSETWVDDQCYFVIERDDYDFRVKKWREDHIPESFTLQHREKITENVIIELWKLTNPEG